MCLDTKDDILLGGFSDGTVRIYELKSNSLLGHTEIHSKTSKNDPISVIKLYNNVLNFLSGTLDGVIYIARIERHNPLKIIYKPKCLVNLLYCLNFKQ